jgi:hypothetical protein
LIRYTVLAACLALALAVANLPAETAQATGNGGTVQGMIVDPTGAVVPGADVTLSNAVTNYNQSVKSGTDGTFRFGNVPMNSYRLQVAAPGFQPYTQDVAIRTQVPIQIKASLVLAGESQTINVSASAEVLENVPAEHTDVTLDH